MANEDSVLKEVDQELAEERQWAGFRKYGPVVIGAAVALVIGVGAWQAINAARTSAANKDAVEFAEAAEKLIESPVEGRAALAAIGAEAGSGYASLAQFRRAASLAADGDREDAIAAFAAIYQDGGAPKPMRELAQLRAAYLSLQDGREIVLDHLGSLQNSDGPYRPYADEAAGIAALKAEDYETALSVFSGLAARPTTPAPLAQRANEYLALAVSGKAGVNLTGKFALDDVIGAVGPDGDGVVDASTLLDGVAPAPETLASPETPAPDATLSQEETPGADELGVEPGAETDTTETDADEPSESGNE